VTPVIFAIDPVLAYMGLAIVDASTRRLVDADLFVSKKADSSRQVFASSDTMHRAAKAYEFLKMHLKASRERGEKVVLVAHESISLPRNAGSSSKIGLSFGVVASFSAELDLPLFEISPIKIKKGFANYDNSKDDVCAGVIRSEGFEHLPEIFKARGIAKSYQNHVSDAAAVGIAACETPVARMLRALK